MIPNCVFRYLRNHKTYDVLNFLFCGLILILSLSTAVCYPRFHLSYFKKKKISVCVLLMHSYNALSCWYFSKPQTLMNFNNGPLMLNGAVVLSRRLTVRLHVRIVDENVYFNHVVNWYKLPIMPQLL